MNKDILIVGSGISVCKENLSKTIDSFNHVVRFNGYQHFKSTEYHGSKLDTIVFNTGTIALEDFKSLQKENSISGKKYILTYHGRGLNPIKRKDQMIQILEKNQIEWTALDILKIAKKLNLKKYVCTSGLAVIHFFLTHSKSFPIYIHGFDAICIKEKQKRFFHYFKGKTLYDNRFWHNLYKEAKIIQSFIQDGKIQVLKYFNE